MKTICLNCESENKEHSKYCSICGHQLPVLENQNVKPQSENTEAAKPKRKIDLKTSIGFAVSFAVVFFLTQYLFNPTIDIDKQLVKVSNEINKSCPLTIDSYTTLNNTIALPNKILQYNYTLIGLTKSEVKIDTVRKYIFPKILQNIRTNPGMKFLRDNKTIFNYNYSDKNGEFVTEYIIEPEMYE